MGADFNPQERVADEPGTATSPRTFPKIICIAAISLAVAFSLDAVTFRTPWYSGYIEPESFAGSYEATLRNERTRLLHGKQHVLVFGDSSIAEGFSGPLANETTGHGDWFFSNVGTPAATPARGSICCGISIPMRRATT